MSKIGERLEFMCVALGCVLSWFIIIAIIGRVLLAAAWLLGF